MKPPPIFPPAHASAYCAPRVQG